MKRTITALSVFILLAGCAALKTDTQRLEAACVGITSTTQILTLHKDELTDSQIDTISDVLDETTPICGEGSEPTATEAELQAVKAAQDKLTDLKEKINEQ